MWTTHTRKSVPEESALTSARRQACFLQAWFALSARQAPAKGRGSQSPDHAMLERCVKSAFLHQGVAHCVVSTPCGRKETLSHFFLIYVGQHTTTLRQREGRVPPPSHHVTTITWSHHVTEWGGSARWVGVGSCTINDTWLHKAVPTSSRSA